MSSYPPQVPLLKIKRSVKETSIEEFMKKLRIDKYLPILATNGFKDISSLVTSPRERIRRLTLEDLKMNAKEELAFVSALAILQTHESRVSADENEVMADIDKYIKSLAESETFLAGLESETVMNIDLQCKIIDDTFDKIIDELQQRRDELKYVVIQEWKNNKLQEIEAETNIVHECDEFLRQVRFFFTYVFVRLYFCK